MAGEDTTTGEDLTERVLIQYDRLNNRGCVFAPEGMTTEEFLEKVGGKGYQDFLRSYELAVKAAETGLLLQTTITLSHVKAFGKAHGLSGVDGLVRHIVKTAVGNYILGEEPSIYNILNFTKVHGITIQS